MNLPEAFIVRTKNILHHDTYNITSEGKSLEEKWELIKKHSRYGKIIIATDRLVS